MSAGRSGEAAPWAKDPSAWCGVSGARPKLVVVWALCWERLLGHLKLQFEVLPGVAKKKM